MILTLATACYRRYDLLAKMIESAERGTRKPDRYYLVDNGGLAHSDGMPENSTIYKPGKNIGVAPAVNQIFRANPELVIWTNDDVVFNPETLGMLEQTMLEDPSRLFALPAHNTGSVFTVFTARKALFEKVGWFDEQFWPAYFEDDDYGRRMNLAGVERHYVATGYYHHVSATIASFSHDERRAHNDQFNANANRYVAKWGGMPGQETETVPR